MKDYYKVLGVSPEAEVEVITAAYTALMRKYHPDTNKSASAAAKAQEIDAAYEVLKSPLQRREYDAKRSQRGNAPPPPPPPPSPPIDPNAADDEKSDDLGTPIFTPEGGLRIWVIYALSFVLTALFVFGPSWISASIEAGDHLWFAEVLGAALVPFGLAYGVARLWKTLVSQDLEQSTHRLRWFWLQVPFVSLIAYGQWMGTPKESEAAVPVAGISTIPEESTIKPTFDIPMPDGRVITGVPDDVTREQLPEVGRRFGVSPPTEAESAQVMFDVTGPDGVVRRVTAPRGATEQDAIAYVAQTYYVYPQ